MVVLGFWKKSISTINSCIPEHLRNPITIGDHIRKRRLTLSMKQGDVGKVIGVSTDCVTYWENNRSKPMVLQIPKIAKFLGYEPFQFDGIDLAGQIKNYRFKHGLSHKKMGKLLGVDASTVGAWERLKPITRKNHGRLNKLFEILHTVHTL